MNSVSADVAVPRGYTANPAPLREVMSLFATGVTVLSVGGEHIHGMTANAFTSVSLDPPSVLCCVAHSAVMYEAITSAGHFGVSIMEAGQEGLARFFADKKRPLGPGQFTGVDWVPGPRTGAPLLNGSLAWLECELSAAHEIGDHTVFIGDVVGSSRGTGEDGLLFFGGAFHRAYSPGR
ncbi:flavin reductase family protein [Streptomyces sp. NBC_01264]|uniref:flavin reductase family protein n=1 Tax=Streptomyces sp. NBC_01264 TaxID=2903804 RepID=UPI00225879D8|nr:flavin reductase family protein [Streptomyces sp. NBC_01264]MCX4783647.1 flavin reductase family protein [Streptomyces sp. NBC_01264]